jgi:hypothetical protein
MAFATVRAFLAMSGKTPSSSAEFQRKALRRLRHASNGTRAVLVWLCSVLAIRLSELASGL